MGGSQNEEWRNKEWSIFGILKIANIKIPKVKSIFFFSTDH